MNITICLPENFLKQESKELLVSSDVKKIWAVELDLLAEFDRICKSCKLKYFIAYGTLLGAVRHKGFIPWDNDVDVVMLRDDFEKLCSLPKSFFTYPYFLQTDQNSPIALRGHAQFRNSDSTAILRSEMDGGVCRYRFNQGIFLDVFPLDSIPDDIDERNAFLTDALALKGQLYRIRYYLQSKIRFSIHSMRDFMMGSGYKLLGWLKGSDILSAKLDEYLRYCRKYNGKNTTKVAPVSFSPGMCAKWQYDCTLFNENTELPFENIKLSAPKDYKKILDINYGDWHKHVIGGDLHGGVVFDADRPYTAYLK